MRKFSEPQAMRLVFRACGSFLGDGAMNRKFAIWLLITLSCGVGAANFGRISATRGVENNWGRQINFILGVNF